MYKKASDMWLEGYNAAVDYVQVKVNTLIFEATHGQVMTTKMWENKMNDQERVMWVENDEYLYRWRLSERLGVWAFVRKYRKEISDYIKSICN